MASLKAKRAAEILVESLGTGKPKPMRHVLREAGYSAVTADKHQKAVTGTETFRNTLAPIVEQLEAERQRVIEAMMQRDLDAVQYDKLSGVLDTLTKNAQLLSGKETDRHGLVIRPMHYGDNSTA